MKNNIEIGEAIRRGRKRKRWSQSELAEKMNVHQTHVSQWEKGKKRIYGEDLIKIAQMLDIVDELFYSNRKESREDIPLQKFLQEQLQNFEKQLSGYGRKIEDMERKLVCSP